MYHFKEAQTEQEYQKIYALRYQVYCLENDWLPPENYPNNLEKDFYDAYSKHFYAEDKNGEVIGTIRLILPHKIPLHRTLPIVDHPNVQLHTFSVPNQCAEISRLVVNKKVRRGDIALGLYRILYQYARDNDIQHWYILVDEIFLKILQKLGFPFKPFACPGEYMGITIPAESPLDAIEHHLQFKNAQFFEWFQDTSTVLKETRLMSKFFRTQDRYAIPKKGIYSRNWAFISRSLQDKLKDTRMFIAGSGLGSVIAQTAVRTGIGRFIVADGDRVEVSNLNRQAFNSRDLSQNKAWATANMIKRIHPDVEVEVIDEFLTPKTLAAPISKADIIVNTIDFDHPAFLDCNRKARNLGKTVFFPINIGWGGALLIFTPESPTLEEVLGLTPLKQYSFDQIKQKLIRKIISSEIPDYLLSLVDIFESPVAGEWYNDPQMSVGCSISSSLVVTAAVSIVAGQSVKVVPDHTYIDFHELVQQKFQGLHSIDDLIQNYGFVDPIHNVGAGI
ncbi:MAG: ThiF family adenylyltransferase [Candidatus Omnitrophica bacterium]|nr:ThiF family adenylyltransferase [Candidatus Omnitrophota bacterium]